MSRLIVRLINWAFPHRHSWHLDSAWKRLFRWSTTETYVRFWHCSNCDGLSWSWPVAMMDFSAVSLGGCSSPPDPGEHPLNRAVNEPAVS